MTVLSTVTSVNKPVSVTLPPASQVSTRRIGQSGLGQLRSALPGI